ncbi:hypothetical protein WD019_12725 [Fictibacillus sp. Mic-4]|uniref:hypothetical protein n=1 Tax=Fictibacillus TaxID=1329200 RepID=UPI001B7F82E7|nr:hypothetical protein [Fictibacillus gelatini]
MMDTAKKVVVFLHEYKKEKRIRKIVAWREGGFMILLLCLLLFSIEQWIWGYYVVKSTKSSEHRLERNFNEMTGQDWMNLAKSEKFNLIKSRLKKDHRSASQSSIQKAIQELDIFVKNKQYGSENIAAAVALKVEQLKE